MPGTKDLVESHSGTITKENESSIGSYSNAVALASDSSDRTEKSPSAFGKVKMLWKSSLRALGLPILTHAWQYLRHPLGKGFQESTKVAIHQDRAVALARALIHVVPVSVALCEIILNWNTYYVGSAPHNQATYQILAKVHELMIQASLPAIIFSGIRNQMAFHEGVPFGLLFSGLQVGQINYLWSMEFWGSLRSGFRNPSRRVLVLLLVPLCILLAAVCGPSSAVLLVPRLQFWPGGSTEIWINATYHDLWPNKTEASSVSEECLVIAPDELIESCPSSQWQRIRDFILLEKQITPLEYKNEFAFAMGPDEVEMPSQASIRQLRSAEDESFLGAGPRPLLATTQHAAISDALTNTGGLWFLSLTNVTSRNGHGHPLSDQLNAQHSIINGYKQPYSTAVCIPDSATNGSDTTPIGIPFLPNANQAAAANGNITYEGCFPGLTPSVTAQTIAHPSMTRGQMFNLPKSDTQYMLHWTELDLELFEGSSIGAIVVLPHSVTNGSREVLICNLSAGWGNTTLSVQTSNGGVSPVESRIQEPKFSFGVYSIKATNLPPAERTQDNLQYHLPYYPQQVINISQDWAQYLNPEISGLNTTVIDRLLQDWTFSCSPRVSAEISLASLLVNGLATSGAESSLQGTLRTLGENGDRGLDGDYWLSGKGNVFTVDTDQSQDWVKLHVQSTLQGYAYNTANVAPRIAIGFLLTYCLFALGHVVYSAWTGISSGCWDSITELTALAMNSTPTTALRNTCAGIKELHIFKLYVRVLVRKDDQGEGEHLELVFPDAEQGKVEGSIIKTNRTYGTLPMMKKLN